jgi:tellurite resistance protein
MNKDLHTAPRRKTDHPALALTESERTDYLMAVGSLVLADGVIDEREMARLRGLCNVLALSGAGEEAVVASASRPDRGNVEKVLASLKQDNALCVALLTDALTIVFADGKLEPAETEHVATFTRALSVPTAQAVLIARHVERVLASEADEPRSGALSKDLATGFTAAADAPRARAFRWLDAIVRR